MRRVRRERRTAVVTATDGGGRDRKSTRLNSSHLVISYAVFCLKKKKNSIALATYPRILTHDKATLVQGLRLHPEVNIRASLHGVPHSFHLLSTEVLDRVSLPQT